MCSFDRVQEITVYISFFVICFSKLSEFGGSVRGGGVWPWVPAGPYHRRLLWCRHRGGSHLYHFCFPRSRPPLFSGADQICADGENLWCARGGTGERPIVPATMTWQPNSCQADWWKFKQVKCVVSVALLPLFGLTSVLRDPSGCWRPSHVILTSFTCLPDCG